MPTKPRHLWQELRRRHVVRVGIGYVIVAGAVGGGAADFLPGLGAPDWVLRAVLGLLVLGLPVALVLAWAYQMTPQGVRREEPESSEPTDAAPGVGADATPTPESWFDARSIAVLPFTNMSDASENEFFADGVTEDILMRLAHVRELHVVSRTSVMRYKDTAKSIREIADELRVGTVLEGSVRRSGDRVRIVAQLIESATDRHLWAETYDRELADVFSVQAEVAEKIARALQGHLAPGDLARMRRAPTGSLEAYDLAIRGRALTHRLRPRDVAQGRRLLEQAIELDPSFVAAHVGLSLSYIAEGYYGTGRPIDAFVLARDLAETALSIDDEAGLAWLMRGMARYHLWDWSGGRADLVRAKELDPGVSDVRLFTGHQLILLRRFEEAIDELRIAADLAPVEPLPHMHLSIALYRAGRSEEAIATVRRATDMDPGFFETPMVHGWFLALQGSFDEAIEKSARGADLADRHPWPTGWLAVIQKAAGNEREALRLAEELGRPEAGSLGAAFSALIEGRIDDAVDALEQAGEDRVPLVAWFAINPAAALLDDAFRRHPRYEALNRRIWGDAPAM